MSTSLNETTGSADMTNIKSTLAMRLAHKIRKQFPKLSFSAALKYGWKVVRAGVSVAKRLVESSYKVEVVRQEGWMGATSDVRFVQKGFVGKIKGLFGASNCRAYIVSLWGEGFRYA